MTGIKNKYRHLLAVLPVAVLMAMACNDIAGDNAPAVPDVGSPISFGVGELTKGLDPIDYLNQLDEKGFGVFAGFSKSGTCFGRGASPDNYISNLKINRDEADTTLWRSMVTTFWPITGSLSFFAYAPYFADAEPPLVFPAGSDRDGMPKGVFTPSADVSAQVDFCLAAPQLDRVAADGRIPFDFKHTLTRIRVYVKGEGTEGGRYQYRLTSMRVKGVIGSNIFTYTDDSMHPFKWDDVYGDTPKAGVYELNVKNNELLDYDEGDGRGEIHYDRFEYVNSTKNGRLYLLPQALFKGAALEATITIYLDTGSGPVPTSVLPPIEILLPTDTPWEAGKTVSYYVVLSIPDFRTATIKAYVEDWIDSRNEHELQILD